MECLRPISNVETFDYYDSVYMHLIASEDNSDSHFSVIVRWFFFPNFCYYKLHYKAKNKYKNILIRDEITFENCREMLLFLSLIW